MVSIATLTLLTLLTWVDVFTFSGYLSSIFVSQKILAAAIIFLSFLYSLFPGKKSISPKYASSIIMITTFLYLGTLTLDGVLGQGTTFSLIRLRPESLLYSSLATISYCLALIIPPSSKVSKSLFRFLFAFSLTFYFVRLLPIVTTQAAVNLRKIITNPLATYEQKMSLEWGDFYKEMLYVKANTSSSAIILIPNDVTKYPLHANLDLVRYFLYPRQLIANPTGVAAPIYQLNPGVTPPLQLFKISEGGV